MRHQETPGPSAVSQPTTSSRFSWIRSQRQAETDSIRLGWTVGRRQHTVEYGSIRPVNCSLTMPLHHNTKAQHERLHVTAACDPQPAHHARLAAWQLSRTPLNHLASRAGRRASTPNTTAVIKPTPQQYTPTPQQYTPTPQQYHTTLQAHISTLRIHSCGPACNHTPCNTYSATPAATATSCACFTRPSHSQRRSSCYPCAAQHQLAASGPAAHQGCTA